VIAESTHVICFPHPDLESRVKEHCLYPELAVSLGKCHVFPGFRVYYVRMEEMDYYSNFSNVFS
jgi:hypothetical protein